MLHVLTLVLEPRHDRSSHQVVAKPLLQPVSGPQEAAATGDFVRSR